MTDAIPPLHRAFRPGFLWEATPLLAYKEAETAPFKAVTRQTLFQRTDLAAELRYFEVSPGGWSTLERHEHVHAVMILRGQGQCLIGREVRDVNHLDLITIPPLTWHQFRAPPDEALGFLCMVNATRDKPQIPTAAELEELGGIPAVAAFLNPGS